MKHSHQNLTGEARLCHFEHVGSHMNPERQYVPEEKASMPESMKGLQEQLETATLEIRNLQEAMRIRDALLQKLQNNPSMPRNHQGRIEIPALEHVPGNVESEVKAQVQKVLESRYLGPKARTYFQQYPERYKRYVPPNAERKGTSPFRIRFNRIDGQYVELWDSAAGEYVRGPTIKTYEQVRAIGQRNVYLREKKLAEREARFKASGVILKDWNRNRMDPRWQNLDDNRRSSVIVGEPYRFIPKSFQQADRTYAERMAQFEAEYKLPPSLSRESEMTYDQIRTFTDLLKSRGVPPNPQQNFSWSSDEQGGIDVWQREPESNAWNGYRISGSGMPENLGIREDQAS